MYDDSYNSSERENEEKNMLRMIEDLQVNHRLADWLMMQEIKA